MDAILLTLAISTLPVAALLYYFHSKDRGEKEPFPLMRDVFIWGILAVFPVIVVEMIFQVGAYAIWKNPPNWYWLAMPFLFIALPEEFAKLQVVRKVAFNKSKFNEVMDGIMYCVIASLGFAVLENVMYTFSYGIEIGILRGFTAVPAHALFSGIMGYYIGMAKFKKTPVEVEKLFSKGLWLAILFHGLYDFLLMSGMVPLMLSVFPLLLFMWIRLHSLIKQAQPELVKARA
jgi:RsiW-degrading membrane proteinase PrsW (M82 family)